MEEKEWSVYAVNSQGGKASLVTHGRGNSVAPSWSHDRRWIYFNTDRTGTFQIWKVEAKGGPEVPVTTNGGLIPLESPDGRDLYFTRSGRPNELTLWKVPVGGGVETKVLDGILYPRAFAVSTQGIYFLEGPGDAMPPFGNSPNGSPPLRFFDFGTRRITTVGLLPASNLAGRITVSPNERWLLYAHDDGSGSDLMLVDPFR